MSCGKLKSLLTSKDYVLKGTSPVHRQPLPVEIDGKDGSSKDIKVPNLAYKEWFVKDQQVMSLTLGSLARDVLAQDTTTNVWSAIDAMYSSHNRARVANTRLTLAMTQKGNQSVAEYIGKMRTLGYEMAAAGRKLEKE
jgi:hypothetical protein